MIVLGISGGHDANWCVCRDGELLGAWEKERFTRRRRDTGEVLSLVEGSLSGLGLTPADIDCLATSEPVKPDQPPGHRLLSGRRYERLDDWQWQVAKCLGRIVPCLSVPHHLAHAAYARFSSPFTDTAVLTVDGVGDEYTVDARAATTISSWRGSRLEWIERVDNADIGSLWFGYSHAIFDDRWAAGKLMGLAAFGTDRLVEEMRDRVVRPVHGTLEGAATVKDCWSDFDRPPFIERTGSWEDETARDAAFAIQAVTTEAGVSLASALRRMSGHTNLALAGGVSLNGYMTTAITREAGFNQVHVPPAVHDGGLAVGAALFAAHHELGADFDPSAPRELAFLGNGYSPERVARAVSESGVDATPHGVPEAVDRAAQVLADGGFVAWYEGRSEHGPRALGHRSILSSPLDDSYRGRLNSEVKFRETFRPVAPVVLEDDASRYFDLDRPSPFMMRIVDANPTTIAAAPAAVHRDNTSRVQTVGSESSLGQITARFGSLTGTPIVINTSLNVRTPIVETPEEALDVFSRSPIDLIYVDGYLAERETTRG